MSDHQVFNQVLFPGAAFFDMALSAAAMVLKTDLVRIRTVAIANRLVLTDSACTLQTFLTASAEGYRFQIYSQAAEAEEVSDWTLHCEGQAAVAEPVEPEFVAIASLQTGLPEVRSAADHYQQCAQRGLQYGSAFRAVQAVWCKPGEALAKIHITEPVAAQSAAHHLHPGVLDACFQAVLAALPSHDDPAAAYVPIGVDCLRRYRPLPTQAGQTLWSWVKLQMPAPGDAALITADVRMLNEAGQVLALASGLTAQKVTPDRFHPEPSPQPWQDWLYQVNWRPIPRLTAAYSHADAAAGLWLVVSDDEATLEAIATQAVPSLQAWVCAYLGEPTREGLLAINPNDPNSIAALLAEISPDLPLHNVIYWVKGHAADTTSAPAGLGHHRFDTLPSAVGTLTHGMLHLVQALINRSDTAAPRLWLVTQGSQWVSGDEPLKAGQALAASSLWALGRAIAQEHPELRCTCLDLDPTATATASFNTLMSELTHEADSNLHEPQIAYRHHTRYGARLVPTRPTPESKSAPTLQLQIAPQGNLDHLRWQPVDRRAPAAHEVELRVEAAGLNFRDVLNALNLYPGDAGPLGLECVGTVVAVGSEANHLRVGDTVMAIAPASFSQFVTVSADLVVPKPQRLTPEEAATIPTAFLTAYYALCQVGQMKKGDRLLIHSAAGGVGQAAVQLAQQAGAEIFATASPKKWDALRQQGIRHVFNSRTLDFAAAIEQATHNHGVTLVLNALSGDFIPQSLALLAPGGRFLEIGKAGIWPAEQVAHHRPDIAYHIIDLVTLTQQQPHHIQTLLHHLTAQFQAQQLQPLPLQVFDGDRAIDAFRHMQNAHHIGKIVLRVGKAEFRRQNSEGRIQKAEGRLQTPNSKLQTPNSSSSLLSHGSCLITGGTGALGLRLAQWLADQGARYLILLSRSGPSPSALAVIRQLEQSGVTVQLRQADLAHFDSLQTALAPYLQSAIHSLRSPSKAAQSAILAASSPVPPLRSIFHLAGLIDDGVFQQQTAARFDAVLAPKVRGTWNLHQLTRYLDVDHFVMFSSVASLMGSAGQSNYATANGFLDAIAHYRHRLGLPALSINWGAWAESGLAANATVNQRLTRTGMQPISPDMGLDVLAHLLHDASPQIGVMPGQGWIQPHDAFFSELELKSERLPHAQAHQRPEASIVERLLTADPDERSDLLRSHLQQQIATVLGIESAWLNDAQAGFMDLGLDSLTSVELRNRLQTSLERPLPATLVYDYPTLSSLTDYLLSLCMPEFMRQPSPSHPHFPQPNPASSTLDTRLATLSDDEAEALLLEELKRLGS